MVSDQHQHEGGGLRTGSSIRHVWLARIEQDVGDPVVIPAASRLLAEEHAEEFVEDAFGGLLGEWYESPDDDGSLVAFSGDRKAVISRQRVRAEYPEGRP